MLRNTVVMTGVTGAPYYSTMYTAGTDGTDAQESTDAILSFWNSIKGLMTSGLTIATTGIVDEVDQATGATVGSFPVGGSAIATTGNAPLPKSTQGLIRWRTGVYSGGREIRGRTFIPALANDAQLVGLPSTALITGVNTAITVMLNALTTAGTGLVVYSPTKHIAADVSIGTLWATEFAVLRSRRD